MHIRTLAALGAAAIFLWSGSFPAAQQALPNTSLTVQVGMFGLEPGGSVLTLVLGAHQRGFESFASDLFADKCSMGAGPAASAGAATARDLWRIRGEVLSLTRAQATVQLEWQRLRSGGAAVQRSSESRPLTLLSGQMVTLERIDISGDLPCDFPPVVLGARYAPSPILNESKDHTLLRSLLGGPRVP